MTFTRTHTFFFSDDDLAELRMSYKKLLTDFADRAEHLDIDIKQRFQHRLGLLRSSIALLAERVD